MAIELEGERRQLRRDRVGAGARGLDDHVGDVVDDVGVVAGEADHRVGIEAAIEDVVVAGAAADQQIVAGAAREVVVAGAAEDQVVERAAGDLVIDAVFAARIWRCSRVESTC